MRSLDFGAAVERGVEIFKRSVSVVRARLRPLASICSGVRESFGAAWRKASSSRLIVWIGARLGAFFLLVRESRLYKRMAGWIASSVLFDRARSLWSRFGSRAIFADNARLPKILGGYFLFFLIALILSVSARFPARRLGELGLVYLNQRIESLEFRALNIDKAGAFNIVYENFSITPRGAEETDSSGASERLPILIERVQIDPAFWVSIFKRLALDVYLRSGDGWVDLELTGDGWSTEKVSVVFSGEDLDLTSRWFPAPSMVVDGIEARVSFNGSFSFDSTSSTLTDGALDVDFSGGSISLAKSIFGDRNSARIDSGSARVEFDSKRVEFKEFDILGDELKLTFKGSLALNDRNLADSRLSGSLSGSISAGLGETLDPLIRLVSPSSRATKFHLELSGTLGSPRAR